MGIVVIEVLDKSADILISSSYLGHIIDGAGDTHLVFPIHPGLDQTPKALHLCIIAGYGADHRHGTILGQVFITIAEIEEMMLVDIQEIGIDPL